MTNSASGLEPKPKGSKAIMADEAQDITPEGARQASAGDDAGAEVFENEDDARATACLIAGFVAAWSERKEERAEAWLADEFRRFPDVWNGEQEIEAAAREIVASIDQANASKQSLQAHLDAGKSRPGWIAAAIERGSAAAGTTNIGAYAANIETALEEANKRMSSAFRTQSGDINRNPNLFGFVAEHHHANTFNLDAAAKGSPLRARVMGSRGRNSMDIGIYDNFGKGRPVGRYQLKYGKSSNVYRGQTTIGPNDVLEHGGVRSKQLNKDQAKALQERGQKGDTPQHDWNDVSRIEIAKTLSKQALISAAASIGLQGARILARRAWNWLRNTENPPPNKDLREFFDASVRSATHVGGQVAVSGAVMVAAKQGLIKGLQRTPPGAIANIVYVGMENARVLYKFATGELSAEEALDAAGNATCSAIGALVGAGKGAILGAMASGPLAPVGAFVGSMAGAMAGSKIGEVVYEGSKIILKTAVKVAGTLYESAAEASQKVGRVLNPFNWAG